MDWVQTVSLAGSISVAVVVIIGETGLFRTLWRIRIVQKHFFPYIHGTFRGTISSNWSIIAAARKAATSDAKLAEHDLHVSALGTHNKQVTVTIHASLLHISMKLVPDDGYTDSQTIWVRPVRKDEEGYPRLYYTYRSRTPGPALPTDVAIHYGTAFVNVLMDADRVALKGIYWTQRDWEHGNNTAGVIEVSKSTKAA
jgi:hypothetical protein